MNNLHNILKFEKKSNFAKHVSPTCAPGYNCAVPIVPRMPCIYIDLWHFILPERRGIEVAMIFLHHEFPECLQLKAFTIDTRPIPPFPDVTSLKGIVLVCIIRPRRRHAVFFYRVCNQISRAASMRYAKSQEGDCENFDSRDISIKKTRHV